MLSVCDFVVICCTLTTETTRLFTSKQFRSMKSTAHLINIARGMYMVCGLFNRNLTNLGSVYEKIYISVSENIVQSNIAV